MHLHGVSLDSYPKVVVIIDGLNVVLFASVMGPGYLFP